MPIPKNELKIERIHSKKKAGGQNLNKVASAVRVTHIPTGIVVRMDGRDQHKNLALATKEVERRIHEAKLAKKAAIKKARRDEAIKDKGDIRTYDFKSGVVTDHRTKKKASIKDVLRKGKIDLLR